MKTRSGIPLNIGIKESIVRVILIIPAGILVTVFAVYLHTLVLVPLPAYLLATGLTSYSPIKHLARLIMHQPTFQSANDPVLGSPVL